MNTIELKTGHLNGNKTFFINTSKVLAILITLAIGGCGKKNETETTNPTLTRPSTSNYSYLYCFNCHNEARECLLDNSQCSVGGCTTGRKTATSLQDHCNDLRNHEANNNCGLILRKRAFRALSCPGAF